jgi:RNA polymerase sigma-70 factor (ECF subfamily)
VEPAQDGFSAPVPAAMPGWEPGVALVPPLRRQAGAGGREQGVMSGGSKWDELPDDELVRASLDDLEAFGVLVQRHQHFVYGAAMRIVRNPTLAQDLAQETFIRAYRGLSGFRGDAQVRSWLYQIATNLAKNAVTRAREVPAAKAPDSVDNRDPARALEQKELSDDLAAAIGRLPDHLRDPFILRELHEMSYHEIADQTGLRLNTVRTRILRARRTLRVELEEWR